MDLQRQAEEILRRSPYVAHVVSRVGSNGFTGTRMQARFSWSLSPRTSARPCRRCWPTCAGNSPRCRAYRHSSRRCRTCASAGVQSKSQYQFVVQGLEQGGTRHLVGPPRRCHEPRPLGLHGRHDRPPEHGASGDVKSTATRRARSASRPTRSGRRSTRASEPGRSRPSMRPRTVTRSSPSSTRAWDGRPTGSTSSASGRRRTASSCRSRPSRRWSGRRGRCPSTSSGSCRR